MQHDVGNMKKGTFMKRFISLMLIIGLLVCLSACGGRHSGGTATPGNLITPTPQPIHTGGAFTDVSESYLKRLCSFAWLDTMDMNYIKLDEDGTFFEAEDEELEQRIADGDGSWSLKKNDEGFLSLWLEWNDGASSVLYDLELYDQSIYAYGEDGTVYLWLMCGPGT